jgi:hypothetical protein
MLTKRQLYHFMRSNGITPNRIQELTDMDALVHSRFYSRGYWSEWLDTVVFAITRRDRNTRNTIISGATFDTDDSYDIYRYMVDKGYAVPLEHIILSRRS